MNKQKKKFLKRGYFKGLLNRTYYNSTSWDTRRRREREKKVKNLFEERMTKNFPNLTQNMDIQLKKITENLNNMNPKSPNQNTSYLKWQNLKDRQNSKSIKRKTVSYLQGNFHKIDFSTETLHATNIDTKY